MSCVRRRWDRLRAARVAVLLLAAVLVARLADIQIRRHERYLALGQRQWGRGEVLSPKRGNLYDRHQRPLALSVTRWRVGVSIGRGEEPARTARFLALGLGGEAASYETRIRRAEVPHLVIAREQTLQQAQIDSLRKSTAVTLEALNDRIYPLDGAGAGLIGFFREQGGGRVLATGVEHKLAAQLAGLPGKAWLFKSGRRNETLGRDIRQEPVDGRHVVLTIDADLQVLSEEELARSLAECDARGGVVIIAQPQTGEILAAASSPLVRQRAQAGGDLAVWNNFNFTGGYEPGSIFKLFTAAALLRNDALDTAAVIDCSQERFDGFRIRNSEGHAYGPLTFMPAFARSSNVYFARAVLALRREAFHQTLRDFGFGQRSGAPYPAEAAGMLPPPDRWSRRSQSTLAIGQELAVTPLQLVMAGCAVANDGWLLQPSLIREVRSADGSTLEQASPARVRRVLSAPQAALLREAMARAVSHGTGKSAAVAWTTVGGKTGTAQKATPGRGYEPGRYMSSFLGFVPAHAPRLVILTMLDEPDPRWHYASQSAAPLFARIVEGIRRSTGWLTGVEGPDPALMKASRPILSAPVPDVAGLSAPAAAARLRRAGMVAAAAEGQSGAVIAQLPGPGVRCAPGDTVRLSLADAGDGPTSRRPCPDLHGLSNRQVAALARRLGVPVVIEGFGYVAAQEPPVGAALDSTRLRVFMEPTWQ